MAGQDNWYALPQDMNSWTTAIIENVSRKIPELPQYIAGVDFNKVDPIVGDADGIMYLMGGLAAVPITVRRNRLAPMDIMVNKNEDFYPLTEAFLQKIYADNVLGEPSNIPGQQDDLQEDGPARQIKYYNTVDKVKQASYERVVELREAIEKSASLVSFFHQHRPEVMSALYSATPEAVKEASSTEEDGDLPELQFLSNSDGYAFNGEPIPVKVASDLMSVFDLSDDERAALLRGGHVCLDYREKHATVYSATSGGPCGPCCGDSDLTIATVVRQDGVPAKGFLYKKGYASNSMYIFIASEFHTIQNDMYILDEEPATVEDFFASMPTAEPQVGMFGLVASKSDINFPMQISGVRNFGRIKIVNGLTHEVDNQEFVLNEDKKFFPIPEARKSLMRNQDEAMYTMPGKNYSVGLDGEGSLIIGGESRSETNAVYHLMDKLAMEYEDAVSIVKQACTTGRATFKVAEFKEDHTKPKDKKDDKKSEDTKSEDTKSEDKGSNTKKAPVDDSEPSEPPAAAEEGAVSSEEQPASPEEQAMAEQEMEQQELAATQQQSAQVNQMPIQSEDLEDIAKINDPTLMDAYLSGKLTDVNTAGREQMMQASDAIVNGIKAVGKVLFLIRLGKVDYIKEEDAQMALNKMSDVARSIGVASSQLM